MKRYALSLIVCLLSGGTVVAQTKTSVEGVWKVSEVVVASRNPAEKGATKTNNNPQPGVLIFTRGYYSAVIVMAEKPRAAVEPAKGPQNLTDAEKIARYEQWRPFAANSGTYEIKGTTLSMLPMVAKNVNVMTRGTPNIREFKLEGPNTLWLIPSGDRAATEPRVKFTRLE